LLGWLVLSAPVGVTLNVGEFGRMGISLTTSELGIGGNKDRRIASAFVGVVVSTG
jgi:hypothetical protein